ncbi:Glycoside hydrolase [Coniochaeta hoffmannii]|uniref:Glycoside hydrolase n=1 Tax=Coniochaeta hoffmannii TaxID=91930 RepID=A0AA38SFI4_9PEZI|nr:Glycoside hydrolase [Coniochaeta hoffmannii]
MRFSNTLAAAVLATGAAAQKNYLGFNTGSTKDDYSAKVKSDFVAEFTAAQNLEGAPGTFNAVRLYTNIQAGSKDDPISAFEAAIETKTSILLGVWCSGTTSIDNEISALKKAVTQYGTKFTDLVIGISIGSEDLYRNSVTGVTNNAGIGTQPDVLLGFINQYKKAVADTTLADVPVGHVDTWDVWPNATNKAVLDAIDWVGVDEYPYYESGKGNTIESAPALFDRAYDATVAAVGGKPVWVTETGWPTTGPNWDLAVPSVENAKYYWDNIGCRKLFNKVPTFWYNLRDSNPDNKMKFAITNNLSTKPYFDLTCPTTFDYNPSSTSSSSSAANTGSTASKSGSGSSTTFTTSASGTAAPTASGSGSPTDSAASSLSTSGASSRGNMVAAAACAGVGLVAGVAALL